MSPITFNRNGSSYTKLYTNGDKTEKYYKAFRKEYVRMIKLEALCGEKYASFFPKYYRCGEFPDAPYICMEYIEGETLESCLSSHGAPRQDHHPQELFTPGELQKICLHAYCALKLLYEVGIIHLDLNPENIILLPQAGEGLSLRFVDFTNFYDATISQERNTHFARIDTHIDVSHPPAVMLKKSFMLFFTRLFFRGDEDYKDGFDKHKQYFNCLTPLFNSLTAPGGGQEDPDLAKYNALKDRPDTTTTDFTLLDSWYRDLDRKLQYMIDHNIHFP